MKPVAIPTVPNVLCLMLTHNGLHMTREAILSVLALDYPEDRISLFVIDNHSSDGTQAWLHSQRGFSTAFVNLPSVAACWNYGMEYAFGMGGYDAVFCLNNDIVLRQDSLKWLTAAAEPFVTCVSVKDPKMLGKPSPTPPKGKRPHPDFSAFLISKQVWQRVGRFNEDYLGGYGEDCEMHVRMHYAGIKAYCIDLPFLHYGSGAIKSADPAAARKMQRAADANRKRFAEEYGCEVGSKEYYAIFES